MYDAATDDVILVGLARRADEALALDHFVVALRAILKHQQAPLVSIDWHSGTRQSGLQRVRFEGGIDDTEFAERPPERRCGPEEDRAGQAPRGRPGVFHRMFACRPITGRARGSRRPC